LFVHHLCCKLEITSKMKKNISTIFGWLLGIAIIVLATYYLNPKPKNSIDSLLVNVAKEINKSCPMQLDKITTLTNTIALPDKVLRYNYSLNLDKDSIDINEMIRNTEPKIINGVKTNPDMKKFRDDNVTLSYNYADRKGIFLFKIDVTPDKYK
jgi:hypothetical protein